MQNIIIGQRYVSSSEPELGLGIITEVDSKFVSILFGAQGETRRFARTSSPLIRAQFDVGDEIRNQNNQRFIVEEVRTVEGLFQYVSKGSVLIESLIHPTVIYNKPEENLFLGKIEPVSKFKLRYEALCLKGSIEKNPYRGFIGPKINLLPHQFYVASKVCEQPLPRVLLADEVGLGKTIEAGLILHHLIVNARATRALVVVPFALVNQWFIELRRHFHLNASIVNKLEQFEGGHNAFMDQALTITSLEFISRNPAITHALERVNFDMVIVDEAHRLSFDEGKPSQEYKVIEEIAGRTPGLLLLSATPEKFGHEGHFARLKLIDPTRFFSYEKYIEEYNHFEKLTENFEGLSVTEKQKLNDEQGTGRILFRNTRENIDKEHSIFAKRLVSPYPLEENQDKMGWLIEFLKKMPEKVLVICRSKETIFEIDDVISNHDDINYALFYSELPLLERDKNAAAFAESLGPKVLICSEVGSEGRNFQFCHHIVFFDLPIDPDIVEQRIGRLDRIGQKAVVNIHIPYELNSFEEILFRWFHEGMNAFSSYMQASSYMLMTFEKYLKEAKKDPDAFLGNNQKVLKDLVGQTKDTYAEVKKLLNSGRNRLIALNSFHKEEAMQIVNDIQKLEDSSQVRQFLNHSFDEFGVTHEEAKAEQYFLSPTETMSLPYFPGLTADGLLITYDRKVATTTEKIDLMTIDHPMVNDLIDLILSQGIGNVSVVKWTGTRNIPALECIFVANLMGQSHFEPARYFSTEVIRVLITLDGKDVSAKLSFEQMNQESVQAETKDLQKIQGLPRASLKNVIAMAKKIAMPQLEKIKEDKTASMMKSLDDDISRLTNLKAKNPNVRDSELAFLQSKKKELLENVKNLDLRLDSLRLGIPK